MLETSWIALALFALAFGLYRRGLRQICEPATDADDALLDAVIGAIERDS